MSNPSAKGVTLLPQKRRGDLSLDQALQEVFEQSNGGSQEPQDFGGFINSQVTTRSMVKLKKEAEALGPASQPFTTTVIDQLQDKEKDFPELT